MKPIRVKQRFQIRFRAMGCEVEAQLVTDGDGDAILAELPARFERLEACLSRFRPQSELSQFNAQAGQWVTLSPVLLENIRLAKDAARFTEGLFNPLVLPALQACGYDKSFERIKKDGVAVNPPIMPEAWQAIELRLRTREARIPAGSALDLGGSAKGWTAHLLADQMEAHGSVLISIGGDIAVRTPHAEDPDWQIDLSEPFGDQTLCRVHLRNGSVVTSAVDYRRWTSANGQVLHHIIDPRTGEPAQSDAISATVIYPDGGLADAFAKSLLVRGGQAGLEWLARFREAAGLIVLQDGAVLATASFPAHMETPASSAARNALPSGKVR